MDFTDEQLKAAVNGNLEKDTESSFQSLVAAQETNPDEFAEATKLGRKHNVAPQFVESDIQRYRDIDNVSQDDLAHLVRNSTSINQWLSQQDNAKLVHDDVGALSYAADKLRSGIAEFAVQLPSTVVGGTGAQMTATADVMRENNMMMGGPLNAIVGRELMALSGKGLEYIAGKGDDVAEYVRPPEERRDFVDSVAGGLGQVSAQLILFARNPAMATAALFATGVDQQKRRLDEAGVTDAETRLRAQSLGGAITAGTERVQLGFLLNRVPGLKKITGKAPEFLKKKWFDKSLDIGSAAGAEAAQETVEGFLQDVVAYATYNPDQEFFQTIKEEAATAGVVGGIARATILALAGRRGGANFSAQEAQANNVKNKIIEAKTAAQETKLIQRDPEKFREYLDVIAENDQEVTLDAAIINELYQDDVDPNAFFDAIPEAENQIFESESTNADITIPASKLVAFLAENSGGEYDFIAEHIKVQDGITPAQTNDADFVNDQIQDIMRQAREEQERFENEEAHRELYDRIERQVRDNLMDANRLGEKARTPDVAAKEAALYKAFARTMIERGGDSAIKTLEKQFGESFEIRGPRTPPPALPITGEDAYIDALRKEAKGKKQGKKPKKTKPLIGYLAKKGRIKIGSPIQQELEAMGITRKAYPRLYSQQGTITSLDNLVASEVESDLGLDGVFNRDEDLNGYIDQNQLLELLGSEAAGQPVQTQAEIDEDLRQEYNEEFLKELSRQGVDITTASNDQVKRAILKAQEDFEGGKYFQDDDQQTKRGSIQFGAQGERVINLFEGADESTFIHETGHLFLDVFGQIASDTDSSQEFKDQYKDALDWLGVQDAGNIGTEQHEKFARGFEAYLYEGKAPSKELRNVFDTFKMFLLNVYKNIKNLNVSLSADARNVYDRLLATDEEIESLKDNPLFGRNEQTMEMLTKKEREDYERIFQKSFEERKHKLFKKALRQKRKESTKVFKEEHDKVVREEIERLQNSKVHKLRQLISTGQDFDENTLLEGEYRVSEKDVVAIYGGREILKYLPRGSRTKGEGVDIKMLADLTGYNSAQEMLEAIMNSRPIKLQAEMNADEEMMRRHGDMLNDGTIEREAFEMVMSQNPELNFVELNALQKKTGDEYPSDGDFKTAAQQAIQNQSVDHAVKPDRYYKAALRNEREYGKQLALKDYEAAADAKRRVILNKYMYKEALTVKQDVDKALKRFQKLSKQPARKKKPAIDPDYHEKIWDILGAYNLGPRLSDSKRLRLEMQAINEWIQEKENNEYAQLLVPQAILDATEKNHYRDLSVNEFMALRDLVVNLETQGRRKVKYINEEEKRDLADLIEELEEVAALSNPLLDKPLSKRDWERNSKRIGNIVGAIDAVNTKASTILAQLDGGDNMGLWTRTIYEPIQAAEIQKIKRSQDEMQNVMDLITKHYGKDFKQKSYRVALGGKNGVFDRQTFVQTFMEQEFLVREGEFTETLTREQILSIAMHQGTEDNKLKLLDGYAKSRGWSQQFIDNALSNMTKRDWEFVQDTWDYLDSFWPEVSQVEKERYGYAPEKLEHTPLEVTTADGETVNLRGGYMRIKYDPLQDTQSEKERIAEVGKDIVVGAGARAQTKNGSTIERVNNVERPIRLDLDVISEHVSEQVQYITMSQAVENVNKVLRKQKVQDAIVNHLGNDYRLMLETWLQDVVSSGQMAGGDINRALRALRTNYTIGRLGLRPMTAMLQFSGLAQTAGDIGTKHMVNGLVKTFSQGNPYKVVEEIKQKSEFMQEREFTLSRDVHDAMRNLTKPGANKLQQYSALMLYPMQKMQQVVDAVAWNASYQKALAEGIDDADAIRKADLAVARSQGSGLVSDLAAIERGTLNEQTQRQEWVKFSTMFFSYFNAKYNVIKNKRIQYKNKQITGTELAMSSLMTFMVEGLISALIMGQLKFDQDDDEEISPMELVSGLGILTLNQGAASLPFVRDVAGAAQGFTAQGAAQAQLSNIGTFVGATGRNIERLYDGEEINYYSWSRGAINTVNAVLPIPAGMLNQLLRGVEREQKEGDSTPMDYLVYRED